MYEDRIFVGWDNGKYFLTTVGAGSDFHRHLTDLVSERGRPDVVEFRAANEGYIPGGDDLDDPDSATDIISIRQQLEEENDESPEYCVPV